ncbi:DUF1569 domain-containing protein [Candidatus Pollutiaquabacter sp.]|uniref:DUF1569 domain-containing protein n=1 Tax=Candidatus Pollutiaquabacter sp. TaxID=3416354 RepID=UPI003CBF1330|nr:DUF1569 domain-containing protein [Bacteroidota bacterium]
MSSNQNLFHPPDFDSILQRIQNLNADAERKWGTMNVHQMVVHCSDPIREVLGIRPTRNLSNLLLRTVGKWMALYGPEWQKGKFPTSPDYDQLKKGTPPTTFESDREQLQRLLEKVRELPLNHPMPAHPAFGKMSRKEWGRLGYRHLDHHLRQFNR